MHLALEKRGGGLGAREEWDRRFRGMMKFAEVEMSEEREIVGCRREEREREREGGERERESERERGCKNCGNDCLMAKLS